MSKSVISEGKTTQEAIEKGLKEIKLPRELCEIKILEENKKSFFDILAPKIVRVEIKEIEARKPEEVEIETTDEELNIAKKDVEEFLNEFLNRISPEAKTKVEIKDKCLYISIYGENIGNLIGYRGETLYSIENILKAKLEILEGMKIPRVIINNDNDLLHKWYEENKEKIEIHTYGINNSSDVIAEKIELGEEKSKFVVKTSSEKVNIDVPVGGEHFVYNALCGFMVGKVLGLTAKEIQNGISKFELTKKRMDIRVLKNGATLINDSYNASYESMKASLKYLSSRTDLRKIAVLGDMLELGDFSKELHEKVGEEVANDNIDVLICRGEFAKNIISKANKNKKTQCILLQNNEEILSKLQEILKEGDGVLIKASNGMKFYEICQKL